MTTRTSNIWSGSLLCVWLFLIALVVNANDDPAFDGDEDFVKANWYTRYPAYPDYCSTPQQMKQRKIPPLQNLSEKYGESRIVHASVVIRHGSRTPWGTDAKCWKGYWDDPSTGRWDCRLTQFVAPPSDLTVEKEEEVVAQQVETASDAVFLFEKKYDALLHHPNNSHGGTAHSEGLSNKLNGTCQVGQLLLRGYEQEFTNGLHLREAYCFNGDKYDHDIGMRLLDLNKEPYQSPQLQYRSDDDERTVMSGQVLLRGLFENEFQKYQQKKGHHPVISLHTADRERDILSGNSQVCPKLSELKDKAQMSRAYQKLKSGKEGQHLEEYMEKHLGQVMDRDPVDCLMTTICNDRPLPDAINDYTGDNERRRWLVENRNCTEGDTNCSETLNDQDYEDDNYDDDAYGSSGSSDSEDQDSETESSSSSSSSDSDDDHKSKSYFQRIYEYSVKVYMFHFLYKDAAYSKLAIAPLWREVMANIIPIIHPENYNRYNVAPETAKLALFSGHDTTIVPLMATLGVWNETDWPPYGSMMIIEIHEIGIDGQKDLRSFKSNFAFRLVYNGRVMTSLVDGCEDGVDLCDVQILNDLVVPLAMKPWKCDTGWVGELESTWEETKYLVTTTGGLVVLLCIIGTSCILGGIGTFVYLTGRFPRCWGDKKNVYFESRRVSEQGISLTQGQFDQDALEQAATSYGAADTTVNGQGKETDNVNLIT